MLRALSAAAYLILFLPVWAVRRAFGLSRFGRRFHRGRSAWDLPPPPTASRR